MKFLKKANRGFIFLILLVLSVTIYIVVCTVKRSDMKSNAEVFINQLIDKDSVWRVIPDEYKDDPEGYVKTIKEDIRPYFENDKAYDAYINNVIMLQFDKNVFLEEVDIDSIFIEAFSYDGKQAVCDIMVNSTTKPSANTGSSDGVFSNYFRLKLCQENNEIKIVSHDFDAYDFIQ